ncbi:hypothetical protein JL722_4461 [Aureococcus anophagefferens]|nr:hypothetical protein JL722_4461 [Aureococcus anophagefferens]
MAAAASAPSDAPSDETNPTNLFRVIAVMVGAAIVGSSPGSIMRVETLCEGRWLASSTFCELPVGKRVAICMLLFTAVMLSDLVLAALRVATRAVVATSAAVAAPRAIGAFASAAFHDAVAEWVARRALRERRARRAHYAFAAERVKAKAEAERQRARGKPPKPPKHSPKARKASAARPRAPRPGPSPRPSPRNRRRRRRPEVVPAEPAGVSYVSPDDGVGVEESKGAEPFEETPSESTEGSSLGTEEEDKLYASLDAELELGSGSTAQRRGAASVPALLFALVALVVLTTAAEVGWLVYEHVRRSAPCGALETAIACARLAALLRHREATERRAGDAAAPDDHLVAFDAYSALNENLLTSCRIDSLQAMMDDLQAAILADASRRSAPRSGACSTSARRSSASSAARTSGLGLVAFVRYQESVAERLDRLSSERKYKPHDVGAAQGGSPAPPPSEARDPRLENHTENHMLIILLPAPSSRNRRSTPAARRVARALVGDGDEAQGHEDEQEEAGAAPRAQEPPGPDARVRRPGVPLVGDAGEGPDADAQAARAGEEREEQEESERVDVARVDAPVQQRAVVVSARDAGAAAEAVRAVAERRAAREAQLVDEPRRRRGGREARALGGGTGARQRT